MTDLTDLLPITLDDQISEVRREIEMRKQVYGRRVAAGSMNRRKADFQIDVMRAVLATLEKARGGNR